MTRLETSFIAAIAMVFTAARDATAQAAGTLAAAPQCLATATSAASASPIRVPIELANNHVLVTVCLRGKALTFLLDSGAGVNILDLGTADDIGLELGAPIQVGGAGSGTSAGAMLDSASVRLPGVPVEVPIQIAVDMRRQKLAKGRMIHGVLGYDFINRFVVAIDYRARELRLYDHATFKYAGAGHVIPIVMENNHPHVRGELTLADGGKVPAKFVIDVGSQQALMITKPVVDQNQLRKRVGQTMPWGGGAGAGGTVTSELGRVAQLTIGPVVLTNVITAMFGDSAGVLSSNRLWDGDVGSDALRRFVVYLDYERLTMILEPHAATTEAFEADMSGIRITPDSAVTGIVVVGVTPGSAAERAGMKVGDRILRVDGKDITALATDALRERWRHAGETVRLTIRRAGATSEVSFVTYRII